MFPEVVVSHRPRAVPGQVPDDRGEAPADVANSSASARAGLDRRRSPPPAGVYLGRRELLEDLRIIADDLGRAGAKATATGPSAT